MELISLYIHIPFCVHRCGYCDFNTYAGLEGLIPAYALAICREIVYLSSTATERLPIKSIYFGGGTPSLLPAGALADILASIDRQFSLTPSVEITLEANPGTVSSAYLLELISLGVNRISFGMQSAHADELALLERQHSFSDVIDAMEWARKAGLTNMNLDLIYGLPGQELETWMNSVEAALALNPEHLSLYALSLETGTPLHQKVKSGLMPEPDADLAADMYEIASDRLAEAGYYQYEISNWARKAVNGKLLACEHNLQYWRNLPYLGIGAGAHGYINKQRTVNTASPERYITRMNSDQGHPAGRDNFPRTPATIQVQLVDHETEIGETMMMGLRLVEEGVSGQSFQQRFGTSLQERFEPQIERLVTLGLLEWSGCSGETLRLTKRGRLLGNQVFKEFI